MALDDISNATAAIATVAEKPATAGGFFFAKPMQLGEYLLTGLHDVTGLEWWATIPLMTLMMRAAIFPLTVFSSRSIARMTAIKPQMDKITEQMKEANSRMTEGGFREGEEHRQRLAALLAKHHVRPWMSMVGAIGQLPLWLTFFFTLRHVARPGAGLGFETGGTLWFEDLTLQDPYYALPIMCGASMYGMVSLGDAGTSKALADADEKQKMMRNVMKGAALIMVPATYWFPTGIFVYWISTNTIGIAQTVALRQPVIRSLVGMPPLPSLPATTGVLGMTPAQATAALPVGPNTEVSLMGSQPISQAVKVAAAAAKPKKKQKAYGKRKKR